jgi:hypothetical protein
MLEAGEQRIKGFQDSQRDRRKSEGGLTMDAATLVPLYLTGLMVVLAILAFVAGAKADKAEQKENSSDAGGKV